jgi:hypothetical protein
MRLSSLFTAVASLAGLCGVVSGNAQPVGTMIAPGIFIQPNGIYMRPNCIFFQSSGVTFNSFSQIGLSFFPNPFGGFFPNGFGQAFFPGEGRGFFSGVGRGFLSGIGRGFSPGEIGRGFFPEGRLGFGFGIDQAILEERAIRRSGTTIGRQDTIAIAPQSGEESISPEIVSRHIQEQERPRNPTGGIGSNALGGRSAGHGGGRR